MWGDGDGLPPPGGAAVADPAGPRRRGHGGHTEAPPGTRGGGGLTVLRMKGGLRREGVARRTLRWGGAVSLAPDCRAGFVGLGPGRRRCSDALATIHSDVPLDGGAAGDGPPGGATEFGGRRQTQNSGGLNQNKRGGGHVGLNECSVHTTR